MVDLVNRLRASGIEDLGLPLPRIAVVGNQSAGKSSLIEAISGVSFCFRLFVRIGRNIKMGRRLMYVRGID
jgi:GTP-binding protein EngB required for normal cell division